MIKNKIANKRWTENDISFVKDNLGKLSFEQMGRELNRSAMSVRLFVLRNRLTVGLQVKRNILMEMLKIKFRHPEDFTPTRAFYKETGINQRRWWDLYYGRKPITGKEYAAVADYLGVTIQEAFDSRQLNLFEEYKG
ncbi:XRE family transcriptional regulator [Prevotella histicola]|uniref:XRE family transcriptional regulator n=1 Tax=Prevotella histicola TaxID=470565 RepID=UPI00352E0865